MHKKTLLIAAAFLSFAFIFPQSVTDEFSEQDFRDDFLLNEDFSTPFKKELQKTFVISGSDSVLNLNAHTSSFSWESQILTGLYEGLFSYDAKSLEPIPAVAESYKISRNKKRWTFTIRDDARFSDGTKITAQSVVDSWLRLQKTPGAPYASLLDCIEGMSAYRENKIPATEVGLKASENNVMVLLNHPVSYLPRILCHHAFSVVPNQSGVYSGAFVLSEMNDEYMTLKKNPEYWDEKNVALPEIKILFSSDRADNTWKFNTGECDWVYASFNADSLINKQAAKLSAVFGTSFFFFTCKNPVWDRADFRLALLTAVPWEELRRGMLIPAQTLIYPLQGYPHVEGFYESNLSEAVELMNDARKSAGIDKDKILEITIGIADTEYAKEQAAILKNAWEKLGVSLVPYKIKSEDYYESISSLNYDIFNFSWIGDFADPVAFLELFKKDSTLNQSSWKNEKFNSLLKTADETQDTAERYKILAEAEQLLLDESVIMPVSHSISLHAVNTENVGGWYSNALDVHPFKYLYFKNHTFSTAPNVVLKK